MDWRAIKRKQPLRQHPPGVYAELEELIRLQFQVADFSLQPRQPVSSILAGRYGSRLRGRGLSFEELRRYHPGDDVRTIDWKVTARTRSPHIRVYMEEKDRQVLLLVDQRINMFFGSKRQMKSVTAAELAAIGAWRALDSGDRIGAIVFNDSHYTTIKPQRSQTTVLNILAEVLHMNHALTVQQAQPSNPAMLNQVLHRAQQMAPKDVLLVLISDCSGVDAETEALITRLARHNDIITLYVHDPSRFLQTDLPVTISNGRLQMELDLSSRRVREELQRNFYAEEAALRSFLRKLSAPLLMISTGQSTVDQLRTLLGVPARHTSGPTHG